LSKARYLTRVVAASVNPAKYTFPCTGEGSVPSVVYTICATPEPPVSVALNVTATGALNHPPQPAPLQLMTETGAAGSTSTFCVLTDPRLPALSSAAYLIVVFVLTLNAPM